MCLAHTQMKNDLGSAVQLRNDKGKVQGLVSPFFCHSRAGGNRDQAVRVKRAKKSESVCVILICDIAKIIPPLTTHTKKFFKDPIPAYAGMTKGESTSCKLWPKYPAPIVGWVGIADNLLSL